MNDRTDLGYYNFHVRMSKYQKMILTLTNWKDALKGI